MRKFLLIIFFALSGKLMSQMNYAVSFPTTTYVAVTAGTSPTLTLAYSPTAAVTESVVETDEGAANNITLPFAFKYNGVNYSTCHISTNGFIALGSQKIDTLSTYYNNSLANGPIGSTASRPIIAPLWDDLDLQVATNLRYITTGTAPNRIFTVQWSNAKWNWQSTTAAINFQVKFYETTNIIDFIYKTGTGTLTSASASIGLADSYSGTDNFISLNGVTNTATASTTTETTTIATKPATNFCVRFTPTAIPAIDATTKLIAAPTVASCLTSPVIFTYIIRNVGTNSIAVGAASLKLTVTGANTSTITKANTKALAFNAFDTITFSGINLNIEGTSQVNAQVILSGDTKASNDTAKYSYRTAKTISSFPVNEDGSLAFFKSAINKTNNSNTWGVSSVGIINGALTDSVKAHSGSSYYYFNPVAVGAVSNGILYSDCITIPSGFAPGSNKATCSFWMTHDNSRADALGNGSNDSLYLSVSTDKGATWTRLAGFDRVNLAYTVPTYQQEIVDLSAYSGQTIQIGFDAVGNYGNFFGLDDISIDVACIPTTSTTNLSILSSQLPFTWNGLTFAAAGSQTAHFINTKGCDSAATLNLSITPASLVLVKEDFNYTGYNNGDTIQQKEGWYQHSGLGSIDKSVHYQTTSLVFKDYIGSGIGGAANFQVTNRSEDINAQIPKQIKDSVYTSFMLKIDTSGGLDTLTDYFFHYVDTFGTTSVTNFRARVFVADGSSAGKFKIGISKGTAAKLTVPNITAGAKAPKFTTKEYNIGQTYLVVVKYKFNSATTKDDKMELFVIDSTIPNSEPTPTISFTDTAFTDFKSVQAIAIRQGSVGKTAGVIDGIRIFNNWTSNALKTQVVVNKKQTIFIDSINLPCGQQNITVPVRVKNFRNVEAISGSIKWDTASLTFISSTLNSTNGLDAADWSFATSSGTTLQYIYSDGIVSAHTLPDSTILFNLNFTKKNKGLTSTTISFSNIPTPLEIDTLDAFGTPYQLLNEQYYNGSVNVKPAIGVTVNKNLSGCKKLVYLGKTYTSSTIVKDTIKTTQGCDSIYNVTNITINTNCVYYVNTTFKVSMTNYLRTGNIIDTGGIRIAGNFADLGVNLPNWTPTSPLCKLTKIGSTDDWTITVPIPDTSINKTLLFKFVNTNWGKNEGIDFGTELRSGSPCAVSDGSGNYNRFLTLTPYDTSVAYCWERCTLCNTTANAPTVTTGSITATTPTVVTVSNNNLLATGGATVTHKGLLVSTNPSPNIYNNTFNSFYHILNPSLGVYNIFISGLNPNVQYYTRAYASNEVGTSYGSVIPFVLCNPAITDSINLFGCKSVVYKTKTYTTSTVARDTLKTVLGCDSIYFVAKIIISGIIAPTNTSNLFGCTNVTYKTKTYTASTVVRDTVRTIQGCDSIYNVANITVSGIVATTNSSNLFGCSSVIYKTKTYTVSTVVRDTVKTTQGCDSIYNVANITVSGIVATNNAINLFGCTSVIYKTKTYTASTLVRDTVKTTQGCDSIYNVANITVSGIVATTNTSNLFGCTSVIYKTKTYTASTVVRDTVKTTLGCDSIYNVANITVSGIVAAVNSFDLFGCKSVVYKSKTYTTSAVVRDTIRNIDGCDIVYNIANITVSGIVATVNSFDLFDCKSVVYKTKTYTASTVVRDTIRNTDGCDIVYNVANIIIAGITPAATTLNLSGCNSVVYKSVVYTASTTFSDTLKSTGNCDSVYITVQIDVTNNIVGNIKHPTKGSISAVTANLTGTANSTSLVSGNYAFNCLPASTAGTIKLSKNNDVKKNNGVSSIDVILVTNHILNKAKLNSPYKIIAADVNNNKTVTNIDVIFMKRLILGVDTSFTGNRLWAFVDSAYKFPDTTNPFPYKDSISFTNLNSSKSNQTFIGVKLGDVNYDWNATLARGAATKNLALEYSLLNSELGLFNGVNQINKNELRVPISVKNFQDLVAMQYTLNFNNSDYDFVRIENNKLGVEFNDQQAAMNGSISFLWSDDKGETKTLQNGDEIFTLVLRNKKQVRSSEWEINNLKLEISNNITEIEAWDGNSNLHNISLSKKQLNNINQDIKTQDFVIYPNPAKSAVSLLVNKLVGEGQIIITDLYGKEVKRQVVNSKLQVVNLKGFSKGMYFVSVITSEGKTTKKLVVE